MTRLDRLPTTSTAKATRLAVVGCLLASLASGCAPGADRAGQKAQAAAQPASRFGDYGDDRPAPYDGRNRYSVYVPMKDGTRIAIDYFLPTAGGVAADDPLPVVLHYTRYVRAWEREDGTAVSQVDQDPILEHLSTHGYAIAVADARGTGASFGVNNGAFSPEETADSYAIVEWLATQPWSSGKVGMQGRSYPGMTQYQAATQAPPGLKAIFAEMAGPTAYDFVLTGGTYKKDFVDQWGKLTKEMDLSRSMKPAPVDADAKGALRDQAVAEHTQNIWAHEILASPESRFRNYEGEAGPNRASWSWDAIATIDDTGAIEASGVAIYHLVGWYDIYTTQQPFLYASLDGVPQKMMIGPWVHSGGYGGTVHKAEILRWYDHWLKGIDNGVMDEEPVHYYVMQGNHTVPVGMAAVAATAGNGGGEPAESSSEVGAGDGVVGADQQAAAGGGAEPEPQHAVRSLDEERAEDASTWIATRGWPPAGIARERWHLAAGPSGTVQSVNDGALVAGAEQSAAGEGRDEYTVDYTSAVGSFSRWQNGYGAERDQPAGTTFFDERTAEDRKALTYTSSPLAESTTIVGYPVAHLYVSSSHRDGDVFVYLEEIDAGGAAHYVSEGALRASYRATAEPPFENFGLPYRPAVPDSLADLPTGEATELVIDLEGTAITIDAGHRLRLTVTGADRANYELHPDPAGKDAPTLTIWRGGEHASYVELPVMEGPET